jgi:hypothetical protein
MKRNEFKNIIARSSFVVIGISLFFGFSQTKLIHSFVYMSYQNHNGYINIYKKSLDLSKSEFNWKTISSENDVLEKEIYSLKKTKADVFIKFSYDSIDTVFKYLSFVDTIPYFNTSGLNSGLPRLQGIVYYAGEKSLRINGESVTTYKFEALNGKYVTDLKLYQFKTIYYLDTASFVPIQIVVEKLNFKTQNIDARYQNITTINSLKGLR